MNSSSRLVDRLMQEVGGFELLGGGVPPPGDEEKCSTVSLLTVLGENGSKAASQTTSRRLEDLEHDEDQDHDDDDEATAVFVSGRASPQDEGSGGSRTNNSKTDRHDEKEGEEQQRQHPVVLGGGSHAETDRRKRRVDSIGKTTTSGGKNVTSDPEDDLQNVFYSRKQNLQDFAAGFVSDFAYRCLEHDDEENEDDMNNFLNSTSSFSKSSTMMQMLHSVETDAAVMFVDMSGYSKLAERLAPEGAHVLATIVNDYFEAILAVVHSFGGDVLKFAGDAIIVAWLPKVTDSPSDLSYCCLVAVCCALRIVETCGSYEYKATGEKLNLHIGVAAGILEGRVLTPGQVGNGRGDSQQHPHYYRHHHQHRGHSSSSYSSSSSRFQMAKAYHFIGGPVLSDIELYVSYAQSGEVCVNQRVAKSVAECPGFVKIEKIRGHRRMGAPLHSSFDANLSSGAASGPSPPPPHPAPSMEQSTCIVFSENSVSLNAAINNNNNHLSPETSVFKVSPKVTQDHSASFNLDQLVKYKSTLDGAMRTKPEKRDLDFDAHFMHPTVIQRIEYGLQLDFLMYQRDICVLFIKKACDVPIQFWFDEVSAVLEKYQCPITQVLEDDKGVHIVAAMNLFVQEPQAADVVLQLLAELAASETGTVIGAAAGVALAGVQGSKQYCRYDITGDIVVRACRMMQIADKKHSAFMAEQQEQQQSLYSSSGVEGGSMSQSREECYLDDLVVALDLSVVLALKTNTSMVKLHEGEVRIKGAQDPIPVFTLSLLSTHDHGGGGALSHLCGFNNAVCRTIHVRQVEEIKAVVSSEERTSCCLVSGPPGAGKKFAIMRALEAAAEKDPKLQFHSHLRHNCRRVYGTLDLCRTLVEWFFYHPVLQLRRIAQRLQAAYEANRQTATVDAALALVKTSVALGLRTAVIIDQSQHIDSKSLELVVASIKLCAGSSKEDFAAAATAAQGGIYNRTAAEGGDSSNNLQTGTWMWCFAHTTLMGSLQVESVSRQLRSAAQSAASSILLKQRARSQRAMSLSGTLGEKPTPIPVVTVEIEPLSDKDSLALFHVWQETNQYPCVREKVDAEWMFAIGDHSAAHTWASLTTLSSSGALGTDDTSDGYAVKQLDSGPVIISDKGIDGMMNFMPLDDARIRSTYAPVLQETLDSLSPVQQGLVVILSWLIFGQVTRVDECWFPAEVVVEILGKFYPTRSREQIRKEDFSTLEEHGVVKTKIVSRAGFAAERYPLGAEEPQSSPLSPDAPRRGGNSSSTSNEIEGTKTRQSSSSSSSSVDKDSEAGFNGMVKLIRINSALLALKSRKQLSPAQNKATQSLVILKYHNSPQWRDVVNVSDLVAAAHWRYFLGDRSGAVDFLQIAWDRYQSRGMSTQIDQKEVVIFRRHDFAFYRSAQQFDCLQEVFGNQLSPCYSKHFSDAGFYSGEIRLLNEVEVPLILGPVAGVLMKLKKWVATAFFFANTNSTSGSNGKTINDDGGCETKGEDEGRLEEELHSIAGGVEAILSMVKQLEELLPGSSVYPWEEEEKLLRLIMTPPTKPFQSEAAKTMGEYLTKTTSDRFERMNLFVSSPDCKSSSCCSAEEISAAYGVMSGGRSESSGRSSLLGTPGTGSTCSTTLAATTSGASASFPPHSLGVVSPPRVPAPPREAPSADQQLRPQRSFTLQNSTKSLDFSVRKGVIRAFRLLEETSLLGVTNPEEKKAALRSPTILMATRDCFMELATCNWSTSYYYQTTMALKDLWVHGDIDALDLKGLLYLHLRLGGLTR